jgi:hypothetical protein
MRARNIKPGFFKNEDLAECDPLARLLFAGLWCMADRSGRIEYRPKRIKAEILPYDNCNCEKLLTQLGQKGFITIYSVEKEIFIQINKFTTHQNCHIKEAESTIPAPDSHGANIILAGPLTDSLLPLTDSPILNPSLPHSGANAGANGKGRFEKFWNVYPKKKSKGDAEKAFRAINPDEQLVETIVSTIERAKKSEDWTKEQGKFIPYPATWLRAKGWMDSETEVDPALSQFSEKSQRTIRNLQNWRPPSEG